MSILGGFDDPKIMALLGAGQGLLSAGGVSTRPVNFGEALGAGLQGGLSGLRQGQQAARLKEQTDLLKLQAQSAQRQQAIREAAARAEGYNIPAEPGPSPVLGGAAPPTGQPSGPLLGAGQPAGNVAQSMPQQAPQASPLQQGGAQPRGADYWNNPARAMNLMMADPEGLGKGYVTSSEMQRKIFAGEARQPGVRYDRPDGTSVMGPPKLPDGMTLNPDGSVSVAPNFSQSNAGIQGDQAAAVALAQKRAALGYDPAIAAATKYAELGPAAGAAAIETQALAERDINKLTVKSLTDSAEKADAAAKSLPAIDEARKLLPNIIAGTGAEARLSIAKALQPFTGSDKPADTEAFMANMATQTLALMKNLGSGTAVSDNDLRFAKAAAGGEISLTRDSIAKILDLNEKYSKAAIEAHNKRIDGLRAQPNGLTDLRVNPDLYRPQPPIAGARKAADGHFYVQQNGKYYRVDQ